MSAVRLAPARLLAVGCPRRDETVRADAAIDAFVLELCLISKRATSSEVTLRGWLAQDGPNRTHLREAPQIEVAVA
jgi:hypothetical protein